MLPAIVSAIVGHASQEHKTAPENLMDATAPAIDTAPLVVNNNVGGAEARSKRVAYKEHNRDTETNKQRRARLTGAEQCSDVPWFIFTTTSIELARGLVAARPPAASQANARSVGGK